MLGTSILPWPQTTFNEFRAKSTQENSKSGKYLLFPPYDSPQPPKRSLTWLQGCRAEDTQCAPLKLLLPTVVLQGQFKKWLSFLTLPLQYSALPSQGNSYFIFPVISVPNLFNTVISWEFLSNLLPLPLFSALHRLNQVITRKPQQPPYSFVHLWLLSH